MRKRATILGIVILVVLAFLFLFDYIFGSFWVGSFPLQVSLVSKSDRRINRITAGVLVSTKESANAVKADLSRFQFDLEPMDWKQGSPFTVRVSCTGEDSGFGRELSYGQGQLLILCVEYADGQKEYVTADIPDGRRLRDITVDVP
jgi:hypothetical protein